MYGFLLYAFTMDGLCDTYLLPLLSTSFLLVVQMSAKPTYISSSGSIGSQPLHVRVMSGGQVYVTLAYLFFFTLLSVSLR